MQTNNSIMPSLQILILHLILTVTSGLASASEPNSSVRDKVYLVPSTPEQMHNLAFVTSLEARDVFFNYIEFQLCRQTWISSFGLGECYDLQLHSGLPSSEPEQDLHLDGSTGSEEVEQGQVEYKSYFTLLQIPEKKLRNFKKGEYKIILRRGDRRTWKSETVKFLPRPRRPISLQVSKYPPYSDDSSTHGQVASAGSAGKFHFVILQAHGKLLKGVLELVSCQTGQIVGRYTASKGGYVVIKNQSLDGCLIMQIRKRSIGRLGIRKTTFREYFRNLDIHDYTNPQRNQGVSTTADEDNLSVASVDTVESRMKQAIETRIDSKRPSFVPQLDLSQVKQQYQQEAHNSSAKRNKKIKLVGLHRPEPKAIVKRNEGIAYTYIRPLFTSKQRPNN